MPAPFAVALCGYRDGRPNTSDAGDKGSVDLGRVFFDAMGVTADASPPAAAVGNLMAAKLSEDLQQHLASRADHLAVVPEQSLVRFEQYSHLSAARELRTDLSADIIRAISALDEFAAGLGAENEFRNALGTRMDRIREEVQRVDDRRRDLLNMLGEESLLKLDVTVSRDVPNPIPPHRPLKHLIAGLSLKWSLRTDRAQDCRSQGAKMGALRRGRMPHFAAVTMEPRPSMLALLCRGSGDVDCVYHLHLPALAQAIDDYCSGTTRPARLAIRDNFNRLRDQRRLRDYDELRDYLTTL